MSKRNRKNQRHNDRQSTHLEVAEDQQVYGLVVKVLGDKRYEVDCSDKKTRICHSRGKLKKQRIDKNDYVLVSLREDQETVEYEEGVRLKADIILKYNEDEKIQLLKEGHITEDSFKKPDASGGTMNQTDNKLDFYNDGPDDD